MKNMDSRPVGIWQAVGIQVVDVHALAAGKLSALMSRRQARTCLIAAISFVWVVLIGNACAWRLLSTAP